MLAQLGNKPILQDGARLGNDIGALLGSTWLIVFDAAVLWIEKGGPCVLRRLSTLLCFPDIRNVEPLNRFLTRP